MKRGIPQRIHRHGGIHRRRGQPHAFGRAVHPFAGFVQTAFLELSQKRIALLLRERLHALCIAEISRRGDADGDLPALIRNHFHHNAGCDITGQHGLLRRSQRFKELFVFMKVCLGQNGFILLLRIAKTLVWKYIGCALAKRGLRAGRQHRGACERRNPLLHFRDPPLWVHLAFQHADYTIYAPLMTRSPWSPPFFQRAHAPWP